jgi:hypothetical protein
MRSPPYDDSRQQLIYVVLAEISLIVTAFLINQDVPELYFPWQSIVSKLVFASICVLGIIAGLSPSWCSFSSKSERRGNDGAAGHHPDCGYFTGHTVRIGQKVFCAGCSGLVLGASLALIGLVSGGYPFVVPVGFWFGVLLVGLGLAQHYIDLGSAWLHLVLNIVFVMGAWLMFEAIQLMNLSFLVSAYFLMVTVFWIFARIRMSQWFHVGVCRGCSTKCMLRFE